MALGFLLSEFAVVESGSSIAEQRLAVLAQALSSMMMTAPQYYHVFNRLLFAFYSVHIPKIAQSYYFSATFFI